MIKFIPCKECIDSLRPKLFELKQECGMIPYNLAKEYAKKWLYDIYSGLKPSELDRRFQKMFNIEHVIPATIISPRTRETQKETEMTTFINREPFYDLHLLFPTISDLNSIRADFEYGKLADNRDQAEKEKEVTKIVNELQYISKYPTKQRYNYIQKVGNLTNKDQSLDIYVDDKNCEKETCIFQPPKKFSGDIARIVFYFFLMYAYDFTERPSTKQRPWFINIGKDQKCHGFNFEEWKIFFFDHVKDFYDWAKNDPVSIEETSRNKKIIELTNVPNIFVGYIDSKKNYHESSFQDIENLLFGKIHDHHKYTDITFGKTKDCISFKIPYEPDLKIKLQKDSACQESAIKENDASKKKQEQLYGQAISPDTSKIKAFPMSENHGQKKEIHEQMAGNRTYLDRYKKLPEVKSFEIKFRKKSPKKSPNAKSFEIRCEKIPVEVKKDKSVERLAEKPTMSKVIEKSPKESTKKVLSSQAQTKQEHESSFFALFDYFLGWGTPE